MGLEVGVSVGEAVGTVGVLVGEAVGTVGVLVGVLVGASVAENGLDSSSSASVEALVSVSVGALAGDVREALSVGFDWAPTATLDAI